MKTRIYAAPAVKELIHCVVVCYVMLHVICAMHGDHVSRCFTISVIFVQATPQASLFSRPLFCHEKEQALP